MPVEHAEPRRCPPQFQERLTRMFGRNLFGDPNFIIVWGQSQFMKMGNSWRDANGTDRRGYRMRYQCHGQPCWVIMRWHSPAVYGSPAAYYANTWMGADDGISGYYITAEYPWKGRYEIVQPLIHKEKVGNELVVTHFPLSHYLLDVVIPMLEAYRRLSQEELRAAQMAAKAAEERKQTEFIADVLEANMPRYLGPVSYTNQGIKTSVLARKEHEIQKVWDRMSRGGRRPNFARGMAQGNAPIARY